MNNSKWFLLVAVVAVMGCESSSLQMEGEPVSTPSGLEMPDLFFGAKGDGGSSNVSMGQVLERGSARSGAVSGYAALPVVLQANQPFLVQAWTDQPSVVFVYGPKLGGEWNFEQVREFSHSIKPGVETQFFNFEPAVDGEYVVIVGGLSGFTTQYIVAWGDEKSSF